MISADHGLPAVASGLVQMTRYCAGQTRVLREIAGTAVRNDHLAVEALELSEPISARKALGLLQRSRDSYILWRGDFQEGKRFLGRISNQLEHKASRSERPVSSVSLAQAFILHRTHLAHRSDVLGRFLVKLSPNHELDCKKGIDVQLACEQAFGRSDSEYLLPLRNLLGAIGASEWRKRGIFVQSLNNFVYPHYGVFCPTVRNEYLDMIAGLDIGSNIRVAYDIGVGSGVLSAVLLSKGVPKVVGTDTSARAIDCARDNLNRLGFQGRFRLLQTDLFPSNQDTQADLIVCNPPWIPVAPGPSTLDAAIYDQDNRFLLGYFQGIKNHLNSKNCSSRSVLIYSDLAERLGLRSREEFLSMIATAGLEVIEKIDARPQNLKISDISDPFHVARSMETTSLWILRVRPIRI